MEQTQSKWSIKKTKVFHDDKRVGTNFDIFEGHELNVVARVRRGDRNLVASAPEMLEMLKVCVLQLPDETAEEVSELIAKAELKL